MKDKLHILQVTGTMNRGGMEVMIMDLIRHSPSDLKFDFLINNKLSKLGTKGDFDDEIISKGGRLFYIGTQWDLGPIKYIIQFKKLIKKIGKPDVIHIHLNSRAGIIALVAKLCGIKKIIAHSHGELVFKGSFIHNLLGILELKFQKILIAFFATDFWGCSFQANKSLFYNRFIKKEKTIVINNAMNLNALLSVSKKKTEELISQYNINQGTLIIGNTGRIVRRKNIGFIIDILNVLEKRTVDFVFVFAGRIDDKEYFEEVEKKIIHYGVGGKIIHLGNHDDIPTVLSTFDIFVSPAKNEAFGMVAAEAQGAGLPCVLSNQFPKTVDMGLQLVTFIDNFMPEYWADIIMGKKGKKCIDKNLIRQEIISKGFDANENAKLIENFYRS